MALPIEIEIGLIRAAGEGIITFDQQEKLVRFLLGLPQLAEAEEKVEQDWLDSIAPTPDEMSEAHHRAEQRQKVTDASTSDVHHHP